jgi:hypothetical protein
MQPNAFKINAQTYNASLLSSVLKEESADKPDQNNNSFTNGHDKNSGLSFL